MITLCLYTQDMEERTWTPEKELGQFILWSNNGQGGALKFTYTKVNGERPETTDKYWYSRKACERAIEDALFTLIKRKMPNETGLTQRQQTNLVKKIKNRYKEK